MNARIYTFVILFITIMVYVVGCRKAGKWLVKNDDPVHADAMVILMGTIDDRVLQAADLYQTSMANKVFIVEGRTRAYSELKARGVNMISGREQVRNALVVLGVPSDSIIILAGDAESTQQEAMIIKEFIANKPEIDTMILVTSSPHTRRASIIFKDIFKKSNESVYLICSPSSYTDFNAEKWWKNKDDIETALLEYLKLMNFVLFERWKSGVN